ncbi:hypothetical protein [Streptomyces sp. NPDC057580]|uniref:hypothetical protein n=1 Tax=Streptomyces sp. NPDC057580 TaxID=3346173 RepID=UPI0036BA7BC5
MSGSGRCSIGFPVRRGSSRSGVVGAGHCGTPGVGTSGYDRSISRAPPLRGHAPGTRAPDQGAGRAQVRRRNGNVPGPGRFPRSAGDLCGRLAE